MIAQFQGEGDSSMRSIVVSALQRHIKKIQLDSMFTLEEDDLRHKIHAFMSISDSLIQRPPQYYEQLLFLIEVFDENQLDITIYFILLDRFMNSEEHAKCALVFDHIKTRFDVLRFVSFNNWSFLRLVSFDKCGWFEDTDWKRFVQNSHNFPNLQRLRLAGNKLTKIDQGEIQSFKSLQVIYLWLNPLTQQTITILNKLKPKFQIYSIQYDRQKIKSSIQQIQQLDLIQSQLCLQDWNLCEGKYYKNKWDVVLQFIDKAQNKRLRLSDNEFLAIPSQIISVQWTCLAHLYLFDNKISNIQFLSFLNATNLTLLWLHQDNNPIINLKVLNKSKWPKLFNLRLSLPLQQIQQVNRIKTKSQNFNLELNLKLNKSGKFRRCMFKLSADKNKQLDSMFFRQILISNQDLSIFAKCESKNLLPLKFKDSKITHKFIQKENKEGLKIQI